jgi:hypothetical protein
MLIFCSTELKVKKHKGATHVGDLFKRTTQITKKVGKDSGLKKKKYVRSKRDGLLSFRQKITDRIKKTMLWFE